MSKLTKSNKFIIIHNHNIQRKHPSKILTIENKISKYTFTDNTLSIIQLSNHELYMNNIIPNKMDRTLATKKLYIPTHAHNNNIM